MSSFTDQIADFLDKCRETLVQTRKLTLKTDEGLSIVALYKLRDSKLRSCKTNLQKIFDTDQIERNDVLYISFKPEHRSQRVGVKIKTPFTGSQDMELIRHNVDDFLTPKKLLHDDVRTIKEKLMLTVNDIQSFKFQLATTLKHKEYISTSFQRELFDLHECLQISLYPTINRKIALGMAPRKLRQSESI